MSLSSPTLQNPAEHYFEWKGGDGHIEFYDREKKERVTVPYSAVKPFEFIVLDQLNGVTGWSDQDNNSIWSNETRSTRDDFTVRAGKRILYVGPYKNEQGISQVAGLGGKYLKVIYIAHKNRAGDCIMGRIGLTGAALNAWIDFTKAHSITSGKVQITGKVEEKKGATTFQVPVFTWTKWGDEEYQQALVLDKLLQNFLSQYLTAPKYDANAEPISEDNYEDAGKATPEQIADFEARKAANTQIKADDFPDDLPPAPDELLNGEPFDDSQIPF